MLNESLRPNLDYKHTIQERLGVHVDQLSYIVWLWLKKFLEYDSLKAEPMTSLAHARSIANCLENKQDVTDCIDYVVVQNFLKSIHNYVDQKDQTTS